MTIRTDVAQDFNDRVSIVDAPSVEFTVQDIVDTLRDREVTTRGISELKLINASGKEDLGGGVSVGITAALQDNLVAFDGRTTPAQAGTVTTASGPVAGGKQTLIDSAATFITNNVARGSLVINFTDQSIAEVNSIVSETEITTKELVNGIGNTYDISDVYQVFNIIQCSISGGNLVAVDDLNTTISPILPTAFTQVILTASSSATATSQKALEFILFQGSVWVDQSSSVSVTDELAGTREFPVSSIADAITIQAANPGIKEFGILGNIAITATDNLPGITIRGQNALNTVVTIDGAADVTDCEIFEASIAGDLDGDIVVRESVLTSVNFVAGFVFQSSFAPTSIVTLGGGASADFLDCFSGRAGGLTPIIDMGGSGTTLSMRGHDGIITLRNKTGPESISIDLDAGQVILDNTIINGDIIVRGIGKLVDINGDNIPSGTWNGVTILNELVAEKTIAEAVWSHIKALTVAKFLGLK